MTPLKVSFTGLEVDPTDLTNRVHYGIIPLEWSRKRFDINAPLSQINRWLTDNIEGRWAIFSHFGHGKRQVVIAFELDYDCSMFILSDGPQRCALAK